jgi:hypoxanthine phosphoribosyltransferase
MLFEKKKFISHSGEQLDFKIECDALNKKDIETLAYIIQKKFKFKEAIGIPNGGKKLALELHKYVDKKSKYVLIVDDVLTTGNSMRECKKEVLNRYDELSIIGIVLFARSKPEYWIYPIFQMW